MVVLSRKLLQRTAPNDEVANYTVDFAPSSFTASDRFIFPNLRNLRLISLKPQNDIEAIKLFPSLVKVSLINPPVKDFDNERLVKSFCRLPSLQSLDTFNHSLESTRIFALASADLKELRVDYCRFASPISDIFQQFAVMPFAATLRKLSLQGYEGRLQTRLS